ncbi:MAG: DUF4956 domain-containing protein [Lachnospiraceae bacterium]|nr:DUF4956 domain-containing protein [Lachnospiraceae bacterium]
MLNTIFSGNITITGIALMIITAVILGILNAMVFSYHSFQSQSFSLTLALVPLISSVIIFMVNDHLGVGVAVAGAFTLVRFRSIAGNGREIIAIFASMALGLILGMGYIGVAALFFVVIAIMTLLLTITGFGGKNNARSLRITIPEDLDYDTVFDDLLTKYTNHAALSRVRTRNMGTLYELTYDVSLKDLKHTKEFMDEIRTRNGNMNVIISTYNDHESI